MTRVKPYRNVRGIGLGPWEYNRRMRDRLLTFAEPSGHIKRTRPAEARVVERVETKNEK